MKLPGVYVPGTVGREVTIRFTGRGVKTDLWGRMVTVVNPTVAGELMAIRRRGYKACGSSAAEWQAIRDKYSLPIVRSAEAPVPVTPVAPTDDPAAPATAAAAPVAAPAPAVAPNRPTE